MGQEVHLLEDSPYRAVHEAAGFIERADLGRLRLRGADRTAYLHGILTNDILALSAGDGCYAALLTPQGRMITDMHVYHLGGETLVTLPRSLAGQIRDRFDQFIFSEDVTVEDASDETVQFGVYGPSAADLTGRLPLSPPAAVLRSADLGLDGFEVVAPASRRDEVERALDSAGAVRIDPATAEVCRVEAGLPRFLVDMTSETIPLEAGIEDRAISMTKSCYPGQEVIVRVLHRGGGREGDRGRCAARDRRDHQRGGLTAPRPANCARIRAPRLCVARHRRAGRGSAGRRRGATVSGERVG
jgi:folate-binding protein YgfZ